MEFLGREEELESLKLLLDKRTSSIVACRGRRRIGKSTLIEEFARRNGLGFINVSGLAPRAKQTNRDQLVNFALQLSDKIGRNIDIPDNWAQAFSALNRVIDDKVWTVVLLDEISWMGRLDPDFAGYLKTAWDDALKKHNKLILVVCGSVSSWIRRNLLDNAAFGGRFSRDIVLRELPISLCRQFWGDRASELPPREILDVLSVTGGVPRYLEEVLPNLSADENVKRLFFHPDGPLFKEFTSLFNEVFGEGSLMKGDVLRMLADGPMTLSEIADEIGQVRGGGLSDCLKDLCEAGFLSEDRGYNPETGKHARIGTYRLCDNYTRFYLKYVEPNVNEIRNGNYRFMSLGMLPGWDAVMGLAFENLVMNNVDSILDPLHFAGVPILSALPYVKRGHRNADGSRDRGLQIDLLIQTRKSVCVVEVKRRRSIGEEIEQEVSRKVDALKVPRGVVKRTALIYEGELAEIVRGNHYFDAIVSASELLRVGRRME